MTIKGTISDFAIDFTTRKQRLTLTLDGDFRYGFDKYNGKVLDIAVKEHRDKRSKNANSYCWVLVGKIAEELNLPAREVYKHAIRHVGVYEDVEMPEKAAKLFAKSWQQRGIGWQTEKVDDTANGVILRAYYGSSTYDTKQMARLIDNIVSDCKELGIETMTPEELSALKDSWVPEE